MAFKRIVCKLPSENDPKRLCHAYLMDVESGKETTFRTNCTKHRPSRCVEWHLDARGNVNFKEIPRDKRDQKHYDDDGVRFQVG